MQWNPSRENDAFVGGNIPPKGGKQHFVLNPQKDCLMMGCGIHNWMQGIVWIFEHPFHAVSAADGSFEIKNVPTDVELTFKAWHETCIGPMPFEQRKLTVHAGANPPIEFSIKGK